MRELRELEARSEQRKQNEQREQREQREQSEQNELARCAIHREVVHYRADTLTCDSEMALPSETPVALVYNGIAHSVMMCSASDLGGFRHRVFAIRGDHRQPARYPRYRAA